MAGQLYLIATPIDEQSPLEPIAMGLLENCCNDYEKNKILIEDIRPGRRRWLRFGLPREAIEHFVEFNEHTQNELKDEIIAQLLRGVNIYLMSDGGLPAFCDPGQKLVRACYENNIEVTCSPHSNSISLAVSLSGIDCSQFFFAGFLAKDNVSRDQKLREYSKLEMPFVLMDTPYRLKKLLEEITSIMPNRKIFLGLDLNCPTQELFFGKTSKILSKIEEFKREFILIVE